MSETLPTGDCIANVTPGPSPFGRLIAFSLYDGPIAGLIECASTGEQFLFQLLAWDRKQQNRVFSLSPIDARVGTKLVASLSQLDQPVWPEWWLDANDSSDADNSMQRFIADAWRAAATPSCLVISSALLVNLISKRTIASDEEQKTFARLSKRTPLESEVTDASFEAWEQFVGEA